MEKKYRTVLDPSGLLRIIALKDFSNVNKGDRGGLIEKESNLSQEGDCWVYGTAQVYGNAMVCDNAKVWGFAKVSENAKIYGNAIVSDWARVYGNAKVYGDAWGDAMISDRASIFGDAYVFGNVEVCGNVKLHSPRINRYGITASIENNKDYIILATGKEFCIFSSNIAKVEAITETAIDYINNIQTIRQIYGEKI